MRQFYTIHEHICTEIKACKKINKISLLTENKQTKQNTIIRQKQSLVHKVPSGVVILLHVCGVSAKTTTLKILSNAANVGRQGILVFYQWKIRMEVATYYFGHLEP